MTGPFSGLPVSEKNVVTTVAARPGNAVSGRIVNASKVHFITARKVRVEAV
jgi:hypothetical protein